MANILINGLNSKTAGGKSILNNYLSILIKNSDKNNYFVLTPNCAEYIHFSNEWIKIIDINQYLKNVMLFPFVYLIILPRMLMRLKIDVVFNLADIPIATKIKQIFLFDWAYAVYPESIVWKLMDKKGLVNRRVKLFLFKKNLKYIDTIIAQSKVMKERLESIYGLRGVKIIPNAVSSENLSKGDFFDFKLPIGTKLLYLTHYYSHKNLEIFIPIAKEILKYNLPYKLIITIDRSQHKSAEKFLINIKRDNLESVIHNIGPIKMSLVPSLYQQCDGLLMPTLLESFSGTFVEAMFHNLPILTSNFDFAIDICGEAAYYFDPLDKNSIIGAINLAFQNQELKEKKIVIGKEKLNELLTWEQVFKKIQIIINDLNVKR